MPTRFHNFGDGAGSAKIYMQKMSGSNATATGTAGRWSVTAGGKKVWGVADQSDSAVLSVAGNEDGEVTCTKRYQYIAVTALSSNLVALNITIQADTVELGSVALYFTYLMAVVGAAFAFIL